LVFTFDDFFWDTTFDDCTPLRVMENKIPCVVTV
jgi:hypothetical protein